MNIDDLAALMGKSRDEIENMLKSDDVLELNLSESKGRRKDEDLNIEVV